MSLFRIFDAIGELIDEEIVLGAFFFIFCLILIPLVLVGIITGKTFVIILCLLIGVSLGKIIIES